jgi:hypothetical protein
MADASDPCARARARAPRLMTSIFHETLEEPWSTARASDAAIATFVASPHEGRVNKNECCATRGYVRSMVLLAPARNRRRRVS